VRFRGYAVDDEAYLSGIRAVAVALNNRRGLPMAIWVVDIASNMDPEKQQLVAEIGAVAVKKLRDQIE
jgi:DNA-binding IclR family transcriptional regulator